MSKIFLEFEFLTKTRLNLNQLEIFNFRVNQPLAGLGQLQLANNCPFVSVGELKNSANENRNTDSVFCPASVSDSDAETRKPEKRIRLIDFCRQTETKDLRSW